MPYWPPDTPPPADGVPQMPAAPNSGPAPVPYSGPDWPLAPDSGAPLPDVSPGSTPGPEVMDSVPGGSPLAAPNVNPYEAGSVSPVVWPGDSDPGGRDIVSGAVAGAVAAAEARFGELRGDTYGLGSHIGDLMSFPPSPLDPGVGSLGETLPTGHYYTPPRGYEGNEPA
jgi:hypothetical protein